MNLQKEFRQLILPLFKGLPLFVVLITIAVLFMGRSISYLSPLYQANGSIKINNLDYSLAAFELFQNGGGVAVPRQNENFLSEVEVFKSHDLIKRTFQRLNWDLSFYRVGQLRLVELFEGRPFVIDYQRPAEKAFDRLYYLEYQGEGRFLLRTDKVPAGSGMPLEFGRRRGTAEFSILLRPNEAFLQEKKNALRPGDLFAFRLNSLEALARTVNEQSLFVRPVDKEISIIRIYYKHEVPEKARLFVDALMDTYIEEGRNRRGEEAGGTLRYLDETILDIGRQLRSAEMQLAAFRQSNKLLNPTQETDAVLREMGQLDLQGVQLDLQRVELERLFRYLSTGNNLREFSPNYDALSDPIFVESYQKIQNYELQRQDLLMRYSSSSPELRNLDEKIRTLRTFIHESVRVTLENLKTKRAEIDRASAEVGSKIKQYPEKERQLTILEREVRLREQMYNYLIQKRTEVAISSASNIFPHRVLDYASRPEAPVSPNKPLLYGLAAFIALLAGMIIIYTFHFFNARVRSKEDLHERFEAPVLAAVPRAKGGRGASFALMANLMANLERLHHQGSDQRQGRLLVLSSLQSREGRSFISVHLAQALAQSGQKVLLVDFNLRQPVLHQLLGLTEDLGVGAILERRGYALDLIRPTSTSGLSLLPAGSIDEGNEALLFSERSTGFLHDLRWHYDVVIVDTPPLGKVFDAVPIMFQSSVNLLIIRSGLTRLRQLPRLQRLLAELEIPRLYIVLNSSPASIWHPGERQRERELSPLKLLKAQ